MRKLFTKKLFFGMFIVLLLTVTLLVSWKGSSRSAFAQTPPMFLDPLAQPQFVNPLPVIKSLGLRIDATGGGAFSVRMEQTTQDLGLYDPLTGMPLGNITEVWGYGVNGGSVTYPGATFVAKEGINVNIEWLNNLPNAHLLPVDESLHWAFGKVSGTFTDNGIPAVTHLHGGHTDSAFDGLPEQWFSSGPSPLYGDYYVTDNYTYDNSQEAATLWYHDHALGITRLNVYAGLAGFYLLRDNNEQSLIDNEMIPSGNYEIEMVIQDRVFTGDGQLFYPSDPALAEVAPGFDPALLPNPSALPEFFGDFILVNGMAWPYLNVEPRQYRFRLLNGSDSRFYNMWITPGDSTEPMGPQFWVIGNDTGLLNAPVPVEKLTIGPGERYDVVVDFSLFAGETLIVRNNGRKPFPKGATVNPNTDGRIMAFVVGQTTTPDGPIAPVDLATNLRPISGPISSPNTTGVPVRKLMLFEATDHFGRLQPLLGTIDPAAPTDPGTGNPLDGTFLWDDSITEKPALGSTEIWEIYNATVDAHPIHLHLVAFQILSRQKFTADVVPKDNPNGHTNLTLGGALRNINLKGRAKSPAAYEAGWKDTVIMYPGEVTRVIATFDKAGRYVWHCHILSHEDHEMMRPYFVE